MRLLDGGFDALEVVIAIFDPLRVPTIGFKPLKDVFGKGDLGITVCGLPLAPIPFHDVDTARPVELGLTDRDVIVIIDGNQVAKLEMTSNTGRFAGNSLHGAAISEEAVGVVIDKVKVGLVELGACVSLCHCETHRIREALA